MELNSIWSVLLSMASESGVWAMLFLTLLIVLIKSFSKREEIYQDIIKTLSKNMSTVKEIKEDVEDLKFVSGIGGNSNLNKETSKEEKTINQNLQSVNDGSYNQKEKTNESKTESKDV